MGEERVTVAGGCICGAVRYEANGEPFATGHCHCHSCRRHTGAPVVTYVGFKSGQVQFSGLERSIYNSSPDVQRAFCGKCGSSLTWEGYVRSLDDTVIEFHIGTLDKPDNFIPEDHSRYEERIAWFDVDDDLPRYNGVVENNKRPVCRGPATRDQTS